MMRFFVKSVRCHLPRKILSRVRFRGKDDEAISVIWEFRCLVSSLVSFLVSSSVSVAVSSSVSVIASVSDPVAVY